MGIKAIVCSWDVTVRGSLYARARTLSARAKPRRLPQMTSSAKIDLSFGKTGRDVPQPALDFKSEVFPDIYLLWGWPNRPGQPLRG